MPPNKTSSGKNTPYKNKKTSKRNDAEKDEDEENDKDLDYLMSSEAVCVDFDQFNAKKQPILDMLY